MVKMSYQNKNIHIHIIIVHVQSNSAILCKTGSADHNFPKKPQTGYKSGDQNCLKYCNETSSTEMQQTVSIFHP